MEEEEEFDIDGELARQGLDQDTDEDENPEARSRPPAANPRASRTAVYDPLIDPSQTQSTKTASTADIQYFFERTEENSTCTHCRYVCFLFVLLKIHEAVF